MVSIKIKVLIKFRTSDNMCIELRAKKLRNMQFAVNMCICEMLFIACIKKHTSTMSPELMKLRIMTISIKLKVLL